jgi:hypothetical protein
MVREDSGPCYSVGIISSVTSGCSKGPRNLLAGLFRSGSRYRHTSRQCFPYSFLERWKHFANPADRIHYTSWIAESRVNKPSSPQLNVSSQPFSLHHNQYHPRKVVVHIILERCQSLTSTAL